MKIIEVLASSVKTYANNPRQFDATVVQSVAKSIGEFGFLQPIVVDGDNVIIVGHVRFAASQLLGLEKVPVVVAKHLTDEQVKAYRLADNKLGELSAWDDSKLIEELEALVFNQDQLVEFGFDAKDLAKALLADDDDELISPSDLDLDFEPDFDEAKEPFTQVNDIYVIGNHKLICGSSTSFCTYKALLGTEQIDLVITDPPYNVNYKGNAGKIKNDNMTHNEFKEFLLSFYICAYKYAKEGCPIYVFFSDAEAIAFREMFLKANWFLSGTLQWVKNHFVLSRTDYQIKHEPCLYGWKEGKAHPWFGGRDKCSVLLFDKPQTSNLHPTTKPVELFKHLIQNSSASNDLVFDGFGGSGTTMVACQYLNRQARLVELEPKFCDVIVKRMHQLWPKIPILKNNEPFKPPE